MATPRHVVLQEVRELPIRALFPFHQFLKDRPWTQRAVYMAAFFSLCPLIFEQIFGISIDIQSAAWAIGTYFALLWGYVLWSIVKPTSIRFRLILGVAAFTAIIGIFVDLLVQQLPGLSSLYSAANGGSGVSRYIGFVFGVGVTEETVKILPVLWLAFRLKKLATPRDAAFYAGISGLAFGVAEAVSYSLNYTQILQPGTAGGEGAAGAGGFVVLEFLRLISLPFLHCVWASITGYYVGLSLIAPSRRRVLILLGLAIAATLHGTYDFAGGSILAVAVAALAIFMFTSYMAEADTITEAIRDPAA
jgi:RsiW-degrading membrane proteinase PrsW (M82 family)